MGLAVDKPFPVPPGPFQGLVPVPFRGGYPMSGIFFQMDKLYSVPGSGGYPYTVFVFRPSHEEIVLLLIVFVNHFVDHLF
jgi:hypothetical protein